MEKPKLFIFGIGGTGARVIKSLTMLLGAGTNIEASEVIPILVDPHQSNEDLKRTLQLLETYQLIYKILGDNRTDFFRTKITTLQELTTSSKLKRTFAFNLKEVANEKFQQYIDHSNLDEANRAMASLLFSKQNLDTVMDIGFVGSPNIGSVVLNQFRESDEFRHFASNFNQNDRVFIISSIFGGTGAAGFPLILKNIRNVADVDSQRFLKDARIGAVSLLPYFGVSPTPGSVISKATFISKSKAALGYYEKNIGGTGDSSVNALYYLGDEVTKDYENDPGSNGQKNDAHFVELAAALSIIDFMAMPDDMLETKDGKAHRPVFKEFGVREAREVLSFTSLGNQTQQVLKNPLTQYVFFMLYMRQYMRKAIDDNSAFAMRTSPKLDHSFLSSSFYSNLLGDFNNAFEGWLKEMARNKRAFAPFELDANQFGEVIADIKPKRALFGGERKIDYHTFTAELNKFEKGKNFATAEKKLISVFHGGIAQLLQDNFDFLKIE